MILRLIVVGLGLIALAVIELVFHRPRYRRRMAEMKARAVTNGGMKWIHAHRTCRARGPTKNS